MKDPTTTTTIIMLSLIGSGILFIWLLDRWKNHPATKPEPKEGD